MKRFTTWLPSLPVTLMPAVLMATVLVPSALLLSLLTPAVLAASDPAPVEVLVGNGGEAPALSSPELLPLALEPEEAWIEAHRAYEEGRYAAAGHLYQGLIDSGRDGGWVQYNLGNSLLRVGELGRAVAAYRAATARLPREGDVRANLTFARQSAKDALAAPDPPVIFETLFFWHFSLSRLELLRWFLISNALLWSLLALRLFYRRTEVLGWIVTAALIVTVATGGSLAVRYLVPMRIAVVTATEIDAHSGTSDDTIVRFKLHAGSEVRLVEQRDNWLRIRLPDGQQAWIDARYAKVVTL